MEFKKQTGHAAYNQSLIHQKGGFVLIVKCLVATNDWYDLEYAIQNDDKICEI